MVLCHTEIDEAERLSCVKELCDAGANQTVANKEGKTPLSLAEETGDAQLIALLQSYVH